MLKVFYIYDTPEAVIKTCSTKRMSLKFPIIFKFQILIKCLKNDTYREKYVLLNSVFEFIEILTWLLLTLFLCLRNQLISIYRKILTKAQPDKGPPEYRSIMVLMQNLSRF